MKRCKHYKHKDVKEINGSYFMVCTNCNAVLYEIRTPLARVCRDILRDLQRANMMKNTKTNLKSEAKQPTASYRL